jgi:glutathione synthase/RimK-type ligase-like ATP-grasp enzyme
MTQRKPKGDIEWTLPDRKRPFAYSTKATSDLIVLLSENHTTVQEAHDMVNYDDEAKNILQHFINNEYGDFELGIFVNSNGVPVMERIKAAQQRKVNAHE